MDAFDLAMRVGMSVLCFRFYAQKYYSSTSLSPLDAEGQRLMTIDWTGPEGRTQVSSALDSLKTLRDEP